MTEHTNLHERATDLLARAQKQGASQADVLVADGDTFSVEVRLAAVDRLTKAREKRLGLRVFFGKRSASASTSDFSEASLERLVNDTCALARAVAEDEVSGLPSPEEIATDLPDLNTYDPVRLDPETQIELARRAESAAMAADGRITNSEGAEFQSSGGRLVLANTHGFVGTHQSSSFSMTVSPIATDPTNGSMQRDAWYTVKRLFGTLETPESVGLEAAKRTVRRLGARKVSTKRVPIVFDPEMAATLLGNLCSAVSGYAVYKGASFLFDHLEKALASELVTIYDDGRLPGGLGSRPFDGEGLPTRRTTVVERGVLKNFLLDAYSARKLGLSSTGNAARGIGDNPTVGPTNFFMVPGESSSEQIIQSVKEGLYVTELVGSGVNPVTGDYSRGAVGLWIENGELAYPVEEITIAGNLKEMLSNIEMIGDDLEFRGRIASPTLKIQGMMVAGT